MKMILWIKKLLLVFLAGVLALLIGVTIAMNIPTAKASSDLVISMHETTSIRTDESKSIRFRTYVNKSYINENAENVQVITMITPSRNINNLEDFDDDFSGENKKVVFSIENGNLIDNGDYKVPCDENNYYYHACIFNVQEKNIAREFSAISYVKLNGVVLEDSYTQVVSESIWTSANRYIENNSDLDVESDEYKNVSALCAYNTATINGFDGETYQLTVKRGQTVAQAADLVDLESELNVVGCAYYEGLGEDANTTLSEDRNFDAKMSALAFNLNQAGTGYVVSQGTLDFNKYNIVKIPEKYNNLDVTETATGMFYNTSTYTGSQIKELYLPKTITVMPRLTLNTKLEILSMPGVSRVYQNELGFTNWALSCNSLKTLIVSAGFDSDGQIFYTNNGGNHDMTVYTMSTTPVSVSIKGTNNDMWNGKVVYYNEGAEKCNTWCWKDDTQIGITINQNQHSYDEETGICSTCNDFVSYGLTYTLNDDGQSYYVSAYDSSVDVVKVYAEYNGKPVTKIDDEVFYSTVIWNGNKVIKELYLPTTISRMPKIKLTNLEVLSMPGVTSVTTSEKEFGRDCPNLKTVIVGDTFTCVDQVFYAVSTQNYDLTIYTTATSATTISVGSTNNNMWNGKVVYYNEGAEKCGCWGWEDSMKMSIKVNNSQHSYDEETGICANCNDFDAYGLTYTLSDDGQSYYVSAYDSSVDVVKIHAKYNNLPVTKIDDEVFYSTQTWNGNKVIKELYLPKTITRMPKIKLTNLEVLSMPGVTNVTASEKEFARACPNLKTVIVGDTFTCVDQVFYNANTQNYDLTIYTTATSTTTISIGSNNNDMWNGIVVYYDENLSSENTWRWTADGMGVETNIAS